LFELIDGLNGMFLVCPVLGVFNGSAIATLHKTPNNTTRRHFDRLRIASSYTIRLSSDEPHRPAQLKCRYHPTSDEWQTGNALETQQNPTLHAAVKRRKPALESRVVTGSEDKTARIWDAEGHSAPVVLKGHEGAVRTVAFSPDGHTVITGSEGSVRSFLIARDGRRGGPAPPPVQMPDQLPKGRIPFSNSPVEKKEFPSAERIPGSRG
jgi:WD40 repeat protein